MNVGVFNMSFKYLLNTGYEAAVDVGNKMILSFCMPMFMLLFIFWIPMLVIAFRSFGKGLTPYPPYAKWFNLLVGGLPAVIIGFAITAIIPEADAFGSAIATMCLSFGNGFTFGGLLAAMPSEERFREFRDRLTESKMNLAIGR